MLFLLKKHLSTCALQVLFPSRLRTRMVSWRLICFPAGINREEVWLHRIYAGSNKELISLIKMTLIAFPSVSFLSLNCPSWFIGKIPEMLCICWFSVFVTWWMLSIISCAHVFPFGIWKSSDDTSFLVVQLSRRAHGWGLWVLRLALLLWFIKC